MTQISKYNSYTTMNRKNQIPAWAPRVSQQKIKKLYQQITRGIFDEELLQDVGISLLVRCVDFIKANKARQGFIECPLCKSEIKYTGHRDGIISCTCGWAVPWIDYFNTIKKKQLSGAQPVIKQFEAYVQKYPHASTIKEKIILIDCLIHGFHIFAKNSTPTRPVAVNLIQGSLSGVIAFLDELSSKTPIPEMQENLLQWKKDVEIAKEWCANKDATP